MLNSPGSAVCSAALRAAESADAPLLLAVSGGLDSMVLLSAMDHVARRRIAGVATFDHGTGAAAAVAAQHVCTASADRGIPVLVGQLPAGVAMTEGREAAWRIARWRFLRDCAERFGARVATAHTEDDQVETVLMRTMRGSGARGLVGLLADTDVVRPFLALRRDAIAAYAARVGLRWVEDPSNTSREFFRNRVRHDLLPALRLANVGIDDVLLDVARRAGALRREIESFVTDHVHPDLSAAGRLVVASSRLTGYDRNSLAVLWSAIAGRAGIALDWRGTRRLAEFTSTGPRAGSIPLAGGWCLEATRDSYVLGRAEVVLQPAVPLPASGTIEWGRFRFHVTTAAESSSPWSAAISASVGGTVRAWTAGDRLEAAAGQPRRRVTRYLSDAGLAGGDRRGWPVVVAGNDVVWIPGVRRSDAATDRSGRPVRHYVCERLDR